MNKKLLAAGIVRDLMFDCQDSLDLYLYAMQHKKMKYEILDQLNREDGCIIIRIVSQYNDSDLIQLFE